ncbi:FKBP-type peptidyl-prolyl cis-trans isomerase [Vibrio owensii]|uniref:FKBP-type peptidyl-prolyl cis-trans isomerase n=1 Tax=Vibrio owensii TaxID=696485 RepID=UPI002FF217FA
MSKQKENKFGLKRYIPQHIKQQIRKEAGYGCVICGSMFCDYEHIEPEFNNAHEHNPDHMTLLCGLCHHHVTGRRKSKKTVWRAKEKPFALTHGHVREHLEPIEDDIICLGNNTIEFTQVAVEIGGKPILWFEYPTEKDEPVLVNAIFSDKEGKKVAFINRNQFTAVVGEADIKSEGTKIEFRPKPREVSLVLNIEADKPISIDRLDMSEKGTSFQILSDKTMQVKQGESTFSISESTISHCGGGFAFGGIPFSRRFKLGQVKKLEFAYHIARDSSKFIDVIGSHLGWLSGNLILNRQYEIVGTIDEQNEATSVFDITGEFLGYLISDSLNKTCSVEMPEPEYETYEPIWVTPVSEMSKFIRKTKSTDVSFRLFGRSFFNRQLKTRESALQQQSHRPSKDLKPQNYVDVIDSIRLGDRAIINFEGFIDNEPFEGGKANNFPIEIGSNRMIEGFEKGLIGAKAGDSVNLELVFPETYHAENLKGKAATFVTKIIKVQRIA